MGCGQDDGDGVGTVVGERPLVPTVPMATVPTVTVPTMVEPVVTVMETVRPSQTPTGEVVVATLEGTTEFNSFVPIIPKPANTATPQPVATSTPLPTPTPSPTWPPPVDFAGIEAGLTAGERLAYHKIGFHTGAGGSTVGLGAWMRQLDGAGVPFFLKSADEPRYLVEAQRLAAASGVEHTLVFRRSGDAYDTPNYDLPPREAAVAHWALHVAAWPAELDKELVWMETMNEVDKERGEWMITFAMATAELALRDGYRWAAFGWSSGEPEPELWRTAEMADFLRLVAAYPEQLAIALHEYSYTIEAIDDGFPYKVGRFIDLLAACEEMGIEAPTILITEWGWEYQTVPDVAQAMADIEWAAALYAQYPTVRGAAIWYLGGYFGEIDQQTQLLIRPVTVAGLRNYYIVD